MSRKSRYGIQTNFSPRWEVGAYIRLSKEDEVLRDKNSQSVLTQKRLIDKYLSEHPELKLADYFIDDGYTGTDMERPRFQDLKEAFESGKINCIIVKDLSRLARNNEESSKLVKVIFPFYKVRFISINDKLDSLENSDSVHRLDISFKNIMNDEYCRDISLKERTASNARRRRGEFLGSFAPYGYKKDHADVHKLIIDEPAAQTVKFIFDEFIRKQNCAYIAQILMDKNVPSPLLYKRMNGSNLKNSTKRTTDLVWSSSSVRRILESEIYIGNLIQCKTGVVSYKNHKVIKKDKEEWIRIEGTHEPIVSKDIFNSVQELLQSRYKAKSKSTSSVFSGLVVCGKCGKLMSVTRYLGKDKYRAFYCNSYYKKRIECDNKRIKESVIETAILHTLNQFLNHFVDIENAVKSVNAILKKAQPQRNIGTEIQKKEAEKRALYAKYKNEELTLEEYRAERQRLESLLEKCRQEAVTYEESQTNFKDSSFCKMLQEAGCIKKITRDIVEKFIKRIKIYSTDRIEVEFTFSDEYNNLLQLTSVEPLNSFFSIPVATVKQ